MPAGFKFNIKPEHEIALEAARFETCYRMTGGFNLDITNLPKGEYVPSLAPLFVDFATRKAYAVKNVRVVEAAASAATSLKVAKGSFAAVGDKYIVGSALVTVSAIDKTHEDYDALTVSALSAAVPSGSVLAEGSLQKLTAKVFANAAANATSVKIAKGSGITGACTLTDGTNDITVSAVDTSRADYDTLTVAALTAKLDAGAVIEEKTGSDVVPVRTANYLNYAFVKVEDGATVTAIGRIFEIDRKKLVAPVSDADVASLGDRFLFLN